MVKTIATIMMTAVGVLFGVQNFDHVPVYLFFGKAIQIRLIFVIAIAGVGGYLARYFIGIMREDVLKKRLQAVRMNTGNKRSKKKSVNGYDDEEF